MSGGVRKPQELTEALRAAYPEEALTTKAVWEIRLRVLAGKNREDRLPLIQLLAGAAVGLAALLMPVMAASQAILG